MTDKAKLEELLAGFKIGYTEYPNLREIVCKEGDRNVNGYSDHYVVFRFNTDGSFATMAVARERSDTGVFRMNGIKRNQEV
jgi:hypothetical protein